jgi:hypothetical protein
MFHNVQFIRDLKRKIKHIFLRMLSISLGTKRNVVESAEYKNKREVNN